MTINAFPAQDATRAAFQEAMADRRLAKSNVQVIDGGLPAAVAFHSENPTPQLIVVETREGGDPLFDGLDQLANVCDAGTQVIVVGSNNDIGTYRTLMARGVSDYLLTPLSARTIIEAVANVFENPDNPPTGRVIAFIGAEGGTGSSTLAHNVAWMIGHSFRDDVIVLDLDIAFGTAALDFNLQPAQTIQQALADPGRLDEQLFERMLAKYDDYVGVLAAPATLDVDASIEIEALDQLLQFVRRQAPFVVLDVPHVWQPWSQEILVEADETVIVASLDLASLRDAKGLVEALNKRRGPESRVRVVINHQGAFRKTEVPVKEFQDAIGGEPALVVPHDPILFGTASNNGQMIGEVNAKHKVCEQLRDFAAVLSGRGPVGARAGAKRGPRLALRGFLKLKPS
ncbi:MAG: AAA family ATPase [Alphaproteobacteria bacterium]